MPTWLSWVRAPSPALVGREELRTLAVPAVPGFLDFAGTGLSSRPSGRSGKSAMTDEPPLDSRRRPTNPGRRARSDGDRRPPTARSRKSSSSRSRSRTSARARSTSRSPSTATTSTSGSTRSSASWSTDAARGRLPARQGAAQDHRTPLPEGSRATRSRPRSCSPAWSSWPRTTTSRRSARRTSTRPGSRSPKQGPLVYEFEVEVRPQFDLPNYKGLKLKRPVHDVHRRRRRTRKNTGCWRRTARSCPRRTARPSRR